MTLSRPDPGTQAAGRWRYVTARLCTAGRPRFTCLRPASFPILIYRPTIPASAASPPAACRIQPVAEDSNTLYHPVSQLPSMLNELVRDHRARRRAQEIGKDESSSVRTTPDQAGIPGVVGFLQARKLLFMGLVILPVTES